MSAIQIQNLKKHFGKVKAVDGIDINIKKGEIFGFLGPNGAGKTTTIRMMMDFIGTDSGSISIEGHDSKKDSVLLKNHIGYLSADPRLYDGWTAKDHIDLVEQIQGKQKFDDELINKLGLDTSRRVKQLSTGNKKKLSLILALMCQPKILIMDEPTTGLDPLLQNTIYEILRDMKSKGTTIFMSSHNLHEVEMVCDRVGIIREGKMVATESIANLRKKKLYKVSIYFAEKFESKDFLFDDVKVIVENSHSLTLQVKEDISPIIKKLTKYKLKDLEIKRASLEDIFMEFYRG